MEQWTALGDAMQVNESIRPRRWQREALQSWNQNMSGVVRVVTGGGKTVFAYLCIEEFCSRYPDGHVIIVVPTIALLDQWYLDICEAMDLEEGDVACYSGAAQPDAPRKVNILVLNTARQVVPQIQASANRARLMSSGCTTSDPSNS